MSISVVIPTFNRRDLIAETLKSICAQTHKASEIIVVDDGGWDQTDQVISQFDAKYIRITNSGPGIARNVGVNRASAEWIAFCDSDDLWMPTYLEQFKKLIDNRSFYGFGNWVDLDGETWTKKDKFSSAPIGFFENTSMPLYEKLVDFTPVWPSATIIKRDFFYKIGGFNPKLSRLVTEDFEFTLRCNAYAPAVILHEPLVGIRKHSGNYSQGKIRQNLSDASILAWARDHHSAASDLKNKIDENIRNRLSNALDEAFHSGDFDQVRKINEIVPGNLLGKKAWIKATLARTRLIPPSIVKLLLDRR